MKDLNIEKVAARFFCLPTISAAISKKHRVTFVEYLNIYRIQKAEELLHNHSWDYGHLHPLRIWLHFTVLSLFQAGQGHVSNRTAQKLRPKNRYNLTISQLLVFLERFSGKRRLCVTGGAQNYNPSTRAALALGGLRLPGLLCCSPSAPVRHTSTWILYFRRSMQNLHIKQISVYSACSVVTKDNPTKNQCSSVSIRG